MSKQKVRVRFVAAPFLPENQPVLGVSSLLAVLRRHGIQADIRYLNIEYGQRIGWDLYYFITREIPAEFLLGDVIFAPALWGDVAPAWEDYHRRFRSLGWENDPSYRHKIPKWEVMKDRIRFMYEKSPEVVRGWAREILEDDPGIVGFSSTFQQTTASLALANQLRRLVPREDLLILLGGANCEGDMGKAIADNFPFVDHVVSGEGEKIILQLVNGAAPRYVTGSPVTNLNGLPIPDFDDYFTTVKGTDLEKSGNINLAAESSRGCWWGQKSQCTFCGLNGFRQTFRSKNPVTFADELRTLAKKYDCSYFKMVDNILNFEYPRTFFPLMIERDERIRMFYEIKSNLKKTELEVMAASGVIQVQPGIESLSTAVLKLMAKGTTLLQNIQLLKWSEEFKIHVIWNILYGFPGESPEEYQKMAELIPLLFHLPPPTGFAKLRLDRFGKYWSAPEDHGLRNIRRFWTYDYVYPGLEPWERDRIAYYFEYDYQEQSDPSVYVRPALEATFSWFEAYERKAVLEVKKDGGSYYVLDTRHPSKREVWVLTSKARCLLAHLDASITQSGLLAVANKHIPRSEHISRDECSALLEVFLERKWVIEENGRFLSLVLDRSQRKRIIRRRCAIQLEQLGLPLPENL